MKHTMKTIITITALTAVFSLCGCSDNADSGSSQNSDSSVSSSDSSSVSEKKTPAKERDMSPFANITKDNFKELCAFTSNDLEFRSVGLVNLTNGTGIYFQDLTSLKNGKRNNSAQFMRMYRALEDVTKLDNNSTPSQISEKLKALNTASNE